MIRVSYVGRSNARIISVEDLISHGLPDPGDDLVWDHANSFTLDVPDAIAAFLIATDSDLVADNGLDFGSIVLDSEYVTLVTEALDVVYVSELELSERVLTYKGFWNASTNTPALSDGTGTQGDFYVVSVGATRDLGSGDIAWTVNDYASYDGGVWARRERPSPAHKEIYGIINTASPGTIVAGEGFSVVRHNVGDVTVTFDEPFSAVPSVVFGASGAGATLGPIVSLRNGTAPTASAFRAESILIGTGFADSIFHFIAKGPT